MFEKFQKSAKVAVMLSQEEAREMDDTRIGAEHVLVGADAQVNECRDKN
ncbi:Putative ATP-dependent Clp protease [Mycobacteroides abscessus]|nr:Putative ATP-dependent Clp protease [Mycobacteroides abscessus]